MVERVIENKSAQQIWEAALGELQIQVNKSNYRTWLEKTAGWSYQDGQFIIGVPNTFVAEYLDQNQRSLIEKVLNGLTHQKLQVQFQVATSQVNPPSRHDSGTKTISTQQLSLPLFNPKYTFDTFVRGNCNQFAYAAALMAAQNPGQGYNPLFIYGGTGLGKTHLLQAIGHVALANNMNVLYVHAEQYTNELMHAFREKKTDDFHSRYRNVDMLLVDDVQFFSGKEQTGENFFHTFETLYSANHQLALTCDRAPREMPQLQERLRSRFEGGLVTDIQQPDFDTRLAILQAKAQQASACISPAVLEFIAHQIQQNIRALEGSLNRVLAYAKLMRAIITPELAAQALQNISEKSPKALPVTPSHIIEAVVNSFQITPTDIKSRKRDQSTVLARQVAMYLIRQETSCSLAEIGQELGVRSSTTITNAYQKIASGLNDSPSLSRKVSEIRQKLHSSTM